MNPSGESEGASPTAAPPSSPTPHTHPPIVHQLGQIYAEATEAEQRYSTLQSSFRSLYGQAPSFLVRAPGRVNLIGEHIDYNGFGVLPMALSRDTIIAARVVTGVQGQTERQEEGTTTAAKVEIKNFDQHQFADFTFSTQEGDSSGDNDNDDNESAPSLPSLFDIPATAPASAAASGVGGVDQQDRGWVRYVQCGIKGVWEWHKQQLEQQDQQHHQQISRFPGLQMLVEGTVPPAAGLSSSSSLVCCAALATAYALHLSTSPSPLSPPPLTSLSTLSKLSLSSLCARSERWVGTAGGGMDQAISFLAAPQRAMRIEFQPALTCTPVALPEQAVFLVAHSATASEKAVTAATHFNKRVLECTLAAHALARHLGVGPYDSRNGSQPTFKKDISIPKLTLREVWEQSGKSLKEMVEWLQQGVRELSPEDEAATPPSPSSSTADSTPSHPLHSHPYTLTELHTLFGTTSLKPLLSFRPALIEALGEDAFLARQKRLAAQATAQTATATPKQPLAPQSHVRVAFGRTWSDKGTADSSRSHTPGLALPLRRFSPLGTKSSSAKDQPFPWERTEPKDKNGAAGSDYPTVEDSLPYRQQGDPTLDTSEQRSLRSSLKGDALVTKGINRLWSLLPKDPASGELTKEEYMNFFMRLCRLFNPDLGFEECWNIIQQDWERDVHRTIEERREELGEEGAQAEPVEEVEPEETSPSKKSRSRSKKKKKGKHKSKDSLSLGPTTSPSYSSTSSSSLRAPSPLPPPAIDLPSLPYRTFFDSVFELIDTWSPDSHANAYADLLELIYNKLTIKVQVQQSRKGEGEEAGALEEQEEGEEPTFALWHRALHVFSEALRVEEFAALCAREGSQDSTPNEESHSPKEASPAATESAVLSSLGRLMSESHASCSQLYECSSPELDTLVDLLTQQAGALGARLTGAGWGGCVVALFDSSRFSSPSSLSALLQFIIDEYYVGVRQMHERPAHPEAFQDLLFVTQPAAGAAIYLPK